MDALGWRNLSKLTGRGGAGPAQVMFYVERAGVGVWWGGGCRRVSVFAAGGARHVAHGATVVQNPPGATWRWGGAGVAPDARWCSWLLRVAPGGGAGGPPWRWGCSGWRWGGAGVAPVWRKTRGAKNA